MKTPQTASALPPARPPRKHRSRPLPRWLKNSEQLEAVARSRCLLVLSVLSGEIPVTDAIKRAKISRPLYYTLETRALKAMMLAMNPLAATTDQGAADLSAATQRITQLQAQVQRLEQENRRAQRLLLLTRKTIRAPVKMGHQGRPPKAKTATPTPPGASSH